MALFEKEIKSFLVGIRNMNNVMMSSIFCRHFQTKKENIKIIPSCNKLNKLTDISIGQSINCVRPKIKSKVKETKNS